MKIRARLGALAVGVSAVLAVGLASPASAAWYPTTQFTNSTLSVDSKANIAKDQMSVNWAVRFTCPAGRAYTLDLFVAQLNPPSVPDLFGEDNGIPASGSAAGTCTGKQQTVNARLGVIPTTWFDRTLGVGRSELLPIGPARAPFTVASAYLVGNGFDSLYCSAPSCAGETGPRITLAR